MFIKRVLSFSLICALVFTSLGLESSIVNAVSNTEITGEKDANEGSGSTNKIAKGTFSSLQQGLRVTIIGYDGKPAMEFEGKDHLDLLYSQVKLDNMEFHYDGCITEGVVGSHSSKGRNSNVAYVPISEYVNKLKTKDWHSVCGADTGEYIIKEREEKGEVLTEAESKKIKDTADAIIARLTVEGAQNMSNIPLPFTVGKVGVFSDGGFQT